MGATSGKALKEGADRGPGTTHSEEAPRFKAPILMEAAGRNLQSGGGIYFSSGPSPAACTPGRPARLGFAAKTLRGGGTGPLRLQLGKEWRRPWVFSAGQNAETVFGCSLCFGGW